MTSRASSLPTLPVDDDELYAPPTPHRTHGGVHSGSEASVADYEHPLDAYFYSHDDDPTLMKITPDQRALRTPDSRLAVIFKKDGEVDFRAWLKSDIPIPPHFPEQHITTLLLFAKISAARMRVANLGPAIETIKLKAANPRLARLVSDSEDIAISPIIARKEQCIHTMLTHARRAIDTAGLLRRPDLQSRGFYYLALAAEDEGNEALAESYFEKALEARGSWEGGMAAMALGIDYDDTEGHKRGRHARRKSIFGEESGSEGEGASEEKMTKDVPVGSLEAELLLGGWRDPFEGEKESVSKEEAVPGEEIMAAKERNVENVVEKEDGAGEVEVQPRNVVSSWTPFWPRGQDEGQTQTERGGERDAAQKQKGSRRLSWVPKMSTFLSI